MALPRFGVRLAASASQRLALVEVPGVYQLGGNTAAVQWSVGAEAASGTSPSLAAGTVHTLELGRGDKVFVLAGSTATPVWLWLLWRTEE